MLGQFFIVDNFPVFDRTSQFPHICFDGFNIFVDESNFCVVKKAECIERKTFLVKKLVLLVDGIVVL
jgi:hypothetical protein